MSPLSVQIREVLGTVKNRRCRGIDGVWGEQQKYGMDSDQFLATILTLLMTIWTLASVPLLWTQSHLTCLFKHKGSAQDAKNYRGISVTATVY